MREILFRGKRSFNGEWVYGSLILWADGDAEICISSSENNEEQTKALVKTETVGQFTGLTDKNGKKIFEGDILKDDWGKVYEVFYTLKSCSFMVKCTIAPNEFETGNYRLGEAWCNTIKVIGNIHDNPDLLEGGAENG